MIKIDGNNVVIGTEKILHTQFMKIGEIANIPVEECEKMSFKAFMFGDMCALIEAINDELGDKEETLKLWTAVAESFVKENTNNE